MSNDTAMLELWLVRHGQSTYNIEKRIQGQIDAPLSEHGRAQARALQPRLQRENFDKVYSSSLLRALETAHLAIPNATIIPDERIRERNFGIYEGKRPQDLSEKEQADFLKWKRNPELPIPEGERQSAFWQRLELWLADLPREGKVVAFCHGGVVYAVTRALFGFQDIFGRGFRFSNAGITVLEYQHDVDKPAQQRFFRLLRANDTAHLENL